MKITLLGFMGSGKSTVGRELSAITGLPLIDLDCLIVDITGMTIPELFKVHGEKGFRELEARLLKETLLREGGAVISTGGGAPAYGKNMEVIGELSRSVFLKTSFETLWERISKDPNRPLVRLGKERLKELYEKRIPYYERAEITVECDGRSPGEIAEEIISRLSST